MCACQTEIKKLSICNSNRTQVHWYPVLMKNENIIFRPHDAKNINQMLDNKIKTAGLLEIVLKKHINQIFYAFYNESIFWWYKNI